ncbi:hypothetical protein HDU77_002794 [Chytriomyces hyalinus]|nr:hypothetical protein HDU77_002794 [Chytriomyces hyalinus]
MKRQRTESNAESKGHRATPDAASDALAMPSLETITATLSVILHTLDGIKETQLSLINAQRHLSNQVCGLQNKSKKFFTQLRDLPLEIIVQIFAWIPLSGEFPALPNLDHLKSLDISRNCFTGSVPTVFSQSRKLGSLIADHNLFNVIPASISQLTSLRNLSMSGNKFSCEIPPGIWNMTALMILKMSGCNIFGSLAGLGGLRNLSTLDVSNNQLSGEFPSREISNMHRLGALHVVGNQFSWGEVLDMSENQFKMTMCMDREFQKVYVIREGFHKCHEEHGVVPFTGDISDSECEDYSEDESDDDDDIINEEDWIF